MRIPRIISPREITENPQKAIKELNEAYLELHRWVKEIEERQQQHDRIINGEDT